MEEEKVKILHVVMFPWLAIGHLRPFLQLSKYLARKGHRVSIISTPRNLQRVAARNKIPQDISHLINLISLPLPIVENLPPAAESSMDVPHVKQQLLKVAFDLMEPSIRDFLENTKPKPDWIVYDYASHWLPSMGAEFKISRAFFCLFTAAFMSFFGTPASLMSQNNVRSKAEDYTVVPEWIPFPSNMAYHLYEMTKNFEKDADGNEYDSGTSDSIRFGMSIDGSDIVIFRSCVEFEPEWFDLIHKLYQKQIFPVGFLPQPIEEEEENEIEDWMAIKAWLDKQKTNSIVCVALGTEATLSREEAQELALGLEQCGLPFFWVLNRNYLLEMLPNGFRERVKDRGMIYAKWAPQIKILSHPAVGGFLTHCGWNSVTEALAFGRALILFPVMNDQGMNARLLHEKKVGIEIPRNEIDGSFSSDSVAESVRYIMISEEGKAVRKNAEQMKGLFGDISRSENYIDSLVRYMLQTRAMPSVGA